MRMRRKTSFPFCPALALHTLASLYFAQDRLRLGNAQINLAFLSPCTIFAPCDGPTYFSNDRVCSGGASDDERGAVLFCPTQCELFGSGLGDADFLPDVWGRNALCCDGSRAGFGGVAPGVVGVSVGLLVLAEHLSPGLVHAGLSAVGAHVGLCPAGHCADLCLCSGGGAGQ